MGHQLQVQHIWMGEEVKHAANKHRKSAVAGSRNSIENTLQQPELPRLVIHVSGAAGWADGKAGVLAYPAAWGDPHVQPAFGDPLCRGRAGGTPAW